MKRIWALVLGFFLSVQVQAKDTDGIDFTMSDPPTKVSGPQLDVQRIVVKSWREGRLNPAERSAHFAWLTKFGQYRIKGWSGWIRETLATPEGWQVTIGVSPRIEEPKQPGRCDVACEFLETYRLDGKKLSFVRAEHTPNSSHFIIHWIVGWPAS